MPKHLILNVGLNDVLSMSSNIQKDMKELVQIVGTLFSKSCVYFVPVQLNNCQGSLQKKFAREINEYESNMQKLPFLADEKFKTEKDKVHWKAHTAKWILKMWLCCVN